MNLLDIVDGHTKNLFNINEDLRNNRLKICRQCPLFSRKFGGMCNNKLWLNPITKDVSLDKKDGYVKGCGCILSAKTRLPNAVCPADKW